MAVGYVVCSIGRLKDRRSKLLVVLDFSLGFRSGFTGRDSGGRGTA
jgi:hypothetical protein